VYDTELMTGYLEAPGVPMPLSAMTAASLVDLGYVVDLTKADPYTVPGPGRRLDENTGKRLCESISTFPIQELSEEDVKAKPGREKEFQAQKERFSKRKHGGTL
jgi:hypothetical protein